MDEELVPLNSIIESRLVTSRTLDFIQHELVDALAERRLPGEACGSIDASCVLVGNSYSSIMIAPKDDELQTEQDDLENYGRILKDAISTRSGNRGLHIVADKCLNGEITTIGELALCLEKRISNTIYIPLIVLIAGLIGVLIWLNA